jgi:hypothetical protein
VSKPWTYGIANMTAASARTAALNLNPAGRPLFLRVLPIEVITEPHTYPNLCYSHLVRKMPWKQDDEKGGKHQNSPR